MIWIRGSDNDFLINGKVISGLPVLVPLLWGRWKSNLPWTVYFHWRCWISMNSSSSRDSFWPLSTFNYTLPSHTMVEVILFSNNNTETVECVPVMKCFAIWEIFCVHLLKWFACTLQILSVHDIWITRPVLHEKSLGSVSSTKPVDVINYVYPCFCSSNIHLQWL